MHADEVDTDEALVRDLLAAQLPQWSALRIEPVLPRGTDNACIGWVATWSSDFPGGSGTP
jgi:aminoglycoside phosphotransferase (APT) family kinase protein